MVGPLLESRERKAPKWMSEVERRLFRRLLRSEINENRYLSQRKFDGIVDYVRACTRLDDLRERLAKEIVSLVDSPEKISEMEVASRKSARKDAAAATVELMEELVKDRSQ